MARKSFDIGRAPRKTPKKEEKAEPKKKEKKQSHPRLSQRSSRRPLRDRRRDAALRAAVLWIVAGLLVVIAILVVLWRPELRISEVQTDDPGTAATVRAIALEELEGRYYGIIPRDSFFFYPERAIRAAILDEYPAVAAVSIGRSGLTSLSVSASPRVAAFLWCGAPSSLSAADTTCYQADAEGFIFSYAEVATTTDSLVHTYAELDLETSRDGSPIRARVEGAERLPEVLRFVRTIGALGIPVASIAIRDDEADLFVEPSTRITFVIGQEKEAQKNAEAAFPTLNLRDGSVEYVDLRFPGKVYLKRVGE